MCSARKMQLRKKLLSKQSSGIVQSSRNSIHNMRKYRSVVPRVGKMNRRRLSVQHTIILHNAVWLFQDYFASNSRFQNSSKLKIQIRRQSSNLNRRSKIFIFIIFGSIPNQFDMIGVVLRRSIFHIIHVRRKTILEIF